MVGLVGFNMFNSNNSVGKELWEMTLEQGGGNPGMKVNPIYVKPQDEENKATEEMTGNMPEDTKEAGLEEKAEAECEDVKIESDKEEKSLETEEISTIE